MRFRYSGVGWAVSDPVHILGQQVEAAWPERHPSDGTVAGGGHVGWPVSDHGPDPNGVVRAIDVGCTFMEGEVLSEQLRLSPDRHRIKYHIWNRRMWSSYAARGYPPFTWRPYSGTNPHDRHTHTSMLSMYDHNSDPFDIDLGGGDMGLMKVEDLQKALIDAGYDLGNFTPVPGYPPGADGDYGPTTHATFVDSMEKSKVTASWVNDRITRATKNMIEWNDNIQARKGPDND